MLQRLTAFLIGAVLDAPAYLLVSGSAFLADFAAYSLGVWSHLPLLAAVVLGYTAGISTHYALSSRLMFRGRIPTDTIREDAGSLARFIFAGVVGMGATMVIVTTLVHSLGMNPYLARILSAGVTVVLVYSLLRATVISERLDRFSPSPRPDSAR